MTAEYATYRYLRCVVNVILTSYFMRLASNEVVHGRCLQDYRFTMLFHKSIRAFRGVRLRKQSASNMVRQTDG